MIRHLFAVLAAAVLLVLGAMFSLVVLAVAAVLGVTLWAYLAWKTRALRRELRARQPPYRQGETIEGDAVVVEGDAVVVEGEAVVVDADAVVVERHDIRADVSLPDGKPRS